MAGTYLEVDLSEVAQVMGDMQKMLSKENFNKLLNRTFKEAAQKSRTLIAREVVKEYAVTQSWVKSAIKNHTLTAAGDEVQCIIPLQGSQGSIGGRFKASGGRKGPISAKILKSGSSTLPGVMSHQGGNPPFLSGGVAFTRRTKARLPIVSISALAVPQMPMNRSADAVEKSLLDYVEQRLWHNFDYMFNS